MGAMDQSPPATPPTIREFLRNWYETHSNHPHE